MHRSFSRFLKYTPVLLGVLALGCARGGEPIVEVDAGAALVRFWVGGSVDAAAVDRVVGESHGKMTLDLGVWKSIAPDRAAEVEALVRKGRLEREDIDTLLARAYKRNSTFPASLAELEREADWRVNPSSWWSFGLTGSMTRFERRLHIPIGAVREAVSSFSSGNGLKYPVGSLVIGEHLEEERVVETTVMRRRADGFWEFAAYDADGRLASRIEGTPDALVVPSDCFGCHYGNRAFEPEKSFPSPAPPGVHGPREIVVPESWKSEEVVRRFDEHARRDDGLLGLYATLWVSSLVSERQAGSLSEADSRLLQSLGF